MSLEKRWEEYRETWADSRNRTEPSVYWMARLREALYAGADAEREEELQRKIRSSR